MFAMSLRHLLPAAGVALAVSLSAPAALAAATGAPAPDFAVVDTKGVAHSLGEYTAAGKTVVLEWTNHECPYVGKHYDPSREAMQTLQKETTDEGIVWLSVVSSAPGKQGYVSAEKADELTSARHAAPTGVVLDPTGALGRLYDAKTTPNMYVVADGKLAYQGAIDSIKSAKVADLDTATNYVRVALDELKAGKAVSTPQTEPYGCSVKY